MTNFDRDYKTLLMKYKNSEWVTLKEKNEWRIDLQIMEEINFELYKDRRKKELYEKYFNEE